MKNKPFPKECPHCGSIDSIVIKDTWYKCTACNEWIECIWESPPPDVNTDKTMNYRTENWKVLPYTSGDKEIEISCGSRNKITVDFDDVDHDKAEQIAVAVSLLPKLISLLSDHHSYVCDNHHLQETKAMLVSLGVLK